MIAVKPSPVQPKFSFSEYDGITIGGQPFRYFETREGGHMFVKLTGEGVPQVMTNAEISRYLTVGNFKCIPNEHQPEHLRARALPDGELLSLRDTKAQKKAAMRLAVVRAFRELLDDETNDITRTATSIRPYLRAIRSRAGEILEEGEPDGEDDTFAVPKQLGAKTVLDWERKERRFGLPGLYDRISERGNRDRRMTADELMIMGKVLGKYLDDQRPSQEIIFGEVKTAFLDENDRRRAAGEAEIVCPSRETVRQAIRKLNPFDITLTRKGREAANRQFAPVGMGLDITRPMQRVEFDEWEVDAITLMAEGGLFHHLTEEEKKALGLDKKKARWWITAAICCATRCIVGMVISRQPNSQSALRVIEMMMRDKGVWGDACGALTPWNQFGWPSVIVTDCASEPCPGTRVRSRYHAAVLRRCQSGSQGHDRARVRHFCDPTHATAERADLQQHRRAGRLRLGETCRAQPGGVLLGPATTVETLERGPRPEQIGSAPSLAKKLVEVVEQGFDPSSGFGPADRVRMTFVCMIDCRSPSQLSDQSPKTAG